MRVSVLDGLRGFFLLFMMIMHFNNVTNSYTGKINHHYFGWVEDAQGFVFISGAVVGIVYGGALVRRGAGVMIDRILKRIKTIYTYHAAVILIFLAAALAFAAYDFHPSVLKPYVAEPVLFTVSSLLLMSASSNLGILPMYIYFMIVTPLVLVLYKRGLAPLVLVVSLFLWTLAQTGLVETLTDHAEGVVSSSVANVNFGIYFNIFAWQVIYFLGLFLGFQHAAGRLDLSFMKRPAAEPVAYACIAVALAFGVLDRVVYGDAIAPAYSERLLDGAVRSNLSYLHLFAFMVDLYLIAYLLSEGPNAATAPLRLLSRICGAVFTFRPLVFLGQHSLQVFAFHLLVVYFGLIFVKDLRLTEPMASVALLLAALSLYLPALAHAWLQCAAATARSPSVQPMMNRSGSETSSRG